MYVFQVSECLLRSRDLSSTNTRKGSPGLLFLDILYCPTFPKRQKLQKIMCSRNAGANNMHLKEVFTCRCGLRLNPKTSKWIEADIRIV